MKKRVLALSLAVIMLFVTFAFAACSKKEDTPDPDPVVAEDTTAGDAAVVADLDAVKAKGTLVVGITYFEPMNYFDENGELVGFETEFAKAVAANLGVDVEFKEIDWDHKIIDLKAGDIDCIWNGMTIREDFKSEIDYSEAYMANKQVAVVRAADSENYTDLASMAGAAFVAEAGSAGEDAILADNSLSGNYVAAETQAKSLQEVKAGASDVAIIDAVMAYSMVGEDTDFSDLLVLDVFDDSANEEYGIGFRKGSDLVAAVNGAMEALAADGTLAQIAKTYGLETRILLDI
ncbi:MAG: transporter substrate-binding domain-containing protein [Clostridia bacterium]|nr:transporter substrate-binding domain-containing protein [Clostridia bacterium]